MKNTSFRDLLTTEVKYVIGIIVFVAGVVAPFYTIKQDIALIKQNHLHHIETISKDIEKLQEANNYNREIIVQLMVEIKNNK